MKIYYLALIFVAATLNSSPGQYISYQPLITSSAFDAINVDVTKPVGRTMGEANVTHTGAATYIVPIDVPPGTNGVIPAVSFTYNSQRGRGVMGWGWSLSALSSITRVPQNFYFDNQVRPVQLDSDDRFALDGQRLLSKSGNYGAPGSEYGLEIEDFSTITLHDQNQDAWFELTTKSGIKMEYGKTTDARLLNETADIVIAWLLCRVTHPDGNYVEYQYAAENREEPRLTKIRYTGNLFAGLQPYNEIEFEYKIRQEGNFSDILTYYIGGSKITSKYLLDKVNVVAEGVKVASYVLTYGHDGINSYLISITERNANDESLNPTYFKYGDQPITRAFINTSIPSGSGIRSFSGDFNGDGRNDLVSATVSETKNGISYFSNFMVHRKNPEDNNFTHVLTYPLPVDYTLVDRVKIPQQYSLITSDFTGDGLDDIMALNIGFDGNSSILNKVTVFEAKNGGNSFSEIARTTSPEYNRIHPNHHFFYAGDFNGDGLPEYLTLLGNNQGNYQVFLCNDFRSSPGCTSVSIPGASQYPVSSWVHADRISVIDFNGDGKHDIMLTGIAGTEIFTFTNTYATPIYQGNFPNADNFYVLGDFNGDGKTDVIAYDDTFSTVLKGVSTGKSFEVNPVSLTDHLPKNTDTPKPGMYKNEIIVGDFNGDGKSDLYYEWHRSRTSNGQLQQFVGNDVFYSSGDNFFYKQLYYWDPILFQPSFNSLEPVSIGLTPLDINGDGKTDLVSSTGNFLGIWIFHGGGKENLLHKVADGFKKVSEWSYKSLVSDEQFYSKGNHSVDYPLNLVQPATLMVEELKTENGIGEYFTQTFNYSGLIYHRMGKGFLGFSQMTSTDINRQIRNKVENELNTTFYFLTPQRTSIFSTADNALLSQTRHTPHLVPVNAKRYWLKPAQIQQDDASLGVTTTSEFWYDSHANLIRQKVTQPGVQSETTEMNYGVAPSGMPGLLTSAEVTTQRHGEAEFQTKTQYTYNHRGQVTSKTEFSGLPKAITSTYQYNNLGNITQVSIQATGISPRSTSFQFDEKGRFALVYNNELSQNSYATYHPTTGALLSVTGVDGLTTTFEYDDWGRLVKTQFPNGVIRQRSWSWNVDGHKRMRCYTTTTGKPANKTFYDVLGREISIETEGFDGQWIVQNSSYDSKGNLHQVSDPRVGNEPLQMTTRMYDHLNRLTQTEHPVFGITQFGYHYANGQLTIATTSPTGTRSVTKDASGKVVRAEDTGGSLHYTYYSHGGVKSVVFHPNGASAVQLNYSTYDPYGRQISFTDLNAGTTEYEYNALGELIWQKTASGDETTFQYNLLGQITTRTGEEGTTHYHYGTRNENGELVNYIKSIDGFAGNKTTYVYNSSGQLTQIVEDNGGQFTTHYTYNASGDINRISYPSGLILHQVYNQRGYLDEINYGSDHLPIYKTLSTNGKGQITAFRRSGSPLQSTISYTNGYPTAYVTPGIQDYHLSWDYPKGLLTSRTDSRAGINKVETFSYDMLHRLTATQISGGPTVGATYDPNGNLIKKTDVGDFHYDPQKRHALIQVNNLATTSISPHHQNISYTPFLQPENITEKSANGENFTLSYTYGAAYNRIKSELKRDHVVVNQRYYYEGGFEREISSGAEKFIHYIQAPTGVIAMIVSENGTHSLYPVYTDHLGSILTVTDSEGNSIADQSFDAWGRRRDAHTWQPLPPTQVPDLPQWLYRGYTGHEHLDAFGLINMNGRTYDPVMGRMLSVDNYVPDGFDSQDYNRYTYARNNPLSYTDPDGEFWHLVIGGGIGGVLNLGVQAALGNVHTFKDGLFAFGHGFLKGGMAAIGCGGCGLGMLLAGSATAVSNAYIPSFTLGLGDTGLLLSISPSFTFGSTGILLGGNVGLYYTSEELTLGANFGIGYYLKDHITQQSGWAKSLGGGAVVGGNDFRIGLFSNRFFGRGLDQTTATTYLESNGWSLAYENDYMFGLKIADGGDKFRTAAVRASKNGFSIGLNLFTGDPDAKDPQSLINRPFKKINEHEIYHTEYGSSPNSFRLGAMYLGKDGYRVGWNSEKIRHIFQNRFAHDIITRGKAKWFEILPGYNSPYVNYQSFNRFTAWNF